MIQSTVAPVEATAPASVSLVSVWAIIGVLASLLGAVRRLSPYVLEAFADFELGALHIVFTVVWTVFMLWSEGHRGFYRGFAPRVAGRALAIARERNPIYVVLAPLVAWGLLKSTPARKLRSLFVIGAVVFAIVMVRLAPQPWRGLIDVGVVAGLAWGAGAVVVWFVRLARGGAPPVALDLPGAR